MQTLHGFGSDVQVKAEGGGCSSPESERSGDPASLSAHLPAPRGSEACGRGRRSSPRRVSLSLSAVHRPRGGGAAAGERLGGGARRERAAAGPPSWEASASRACLPRAEPGGVRPRSAALSRAGLVRGRRSVSPLGTAARALHSQGRWPEEALLQLPLFLLAGHGRPGRLRR